MFNENLLEIAKIILNSCGNNWHNSGTVFTLVSISLISLPGHLTLHLFKCVPLPLKVLSCPIK